MIRDDGSPRAEVRNLLVAFARVLLFLVIGLSLGASGPVLLGWRSGVVLSGSMSPLLRPGDIVVTAPTRRTPAVGTVVAVRDPARPGRILVHRIHAIAKNGDLITKGDANDTPDSTPVAPSQVVGVGRLRVPYLGLLTLWVQQRAYGKLFITALAVIGLGWLGTSRGAGHRPSGSAVEESRPRAGLMWGRHVRRRQSATGTPSPRPDRAKAPFAHRLPRLGAPLSSRLEARGRHLRAARALRRSPDPLTPGPRTPLPRTANPPTPSPLIAGSPNPLPFLSARPSSPTPPAQLPEPAIRLATLTSPRAMTTSTPWAVFPWPPVTALPTDAAVEERPGHPVCSAPKSGVTSSHLPVTRRHRTRGVPSLSAGSRKVRRRPGSGPLAGSDPGPIPPPIPG